MKNFSKNFEIAMLLLFSIAMGGLLFSGLNRLIELLINRS